MTDEQLAEYLGMPRMCACGRSLGGGQINGKPVCDQCYRSSQAREWARIQDEWARIQDEEKNDGKIGENS